jgi:hypothetical protein
MQVTPPRSWGNILLERAGDDRWSFGSRGKSGHYTAACPVKAGEGGVHAPLDGKCRRKYTALFLLIGRQGKGEMAR